MFTLTLGLQVNEPDPTQLHLLTSLKETQNKGPDWDKYSCSDVSKLHDIFCGRRLRYCS